MIKKRYKIFRYLLGLAMLSFIALAVVFSVVLNREEESRSCEIDITLCNGMDSSESLPAVESWRITLTAPNGKSSVVTLPGDITATTREVTVPGAWTIVAEALNSDARVIGRGVTVVVVSESRTVYAEIEILKTESAYGMLTVGIDGAGSYTVRVYNESLSSLVAEDRIGSSDGKNSVSFSLDEGIYTFMILSAFNNSNVLTSERIEVKNGKDISFSYVGGDDLSFSLTDASVPDDSLSIVLSDHVVHAEDEIILSIADADEGDTYEWYIGGKRLDDASPSVLCAFPEEEETEILCLVRDRESSAVRTAERTIKVHEKGYVTKIGFVIINDESDQGYTMNFLDGMDNAVKMLEDDGYEVEVVTKKGVTESDSAREANDELASDGCEIIFNNSYGFEPYMLSVADNYPDTLFVSLTNCESQSDGRDNTYNAYAAIYEGRYVSGVAAGMKLNELIENGTIRKEEAVVGYVGTYSLGEVVSGMTAYYLGVRSVCPSAVMKVFFVDTWGDMTLEEAATDSLIDHGCVMISQHSDTISPALTAQKRGVYHTGYNADMTEVAPLSSLLSCRIDWTRYFYTFIRNYLDGVENPSDWTGTMKDGDVVVTALNEVIAAPGTEEKIREVEEAIISGDLNVFDTSTFTVDGETLTHTYALDTDGDYVPDSGEAVWDGVFHESYSAYQSSPYFRCVIDGIVWLNEPGK